MTTVRTINGTTYEHGSLEFKLGTLTATPERTNRTRYLFSEVWLVNGPTAKQKQRDAFPVMRSSPTAVILALRDGLFRSALNAGGFSTDPKDAK